MKLQIVRPRQHLETVEHSRVFHWRDMPGAGFGFPSDALGDVNVNTLSGPAASNYRQCINGTLDVIDDGVQTYRHTYIQPAEGRCECGQIVTLDGDTCGEGIDCACGRAYNTVGQALAPRSQWDESGSENY